MRPDADFYRSKLSEVYAELERRNVDAALLLNPISVFYLTGFSDMPLSIAEYPVFLLVSARSEPTLFVSADVFGHAESPLSEVVEEVRPYGEYPYVNGVPTIEWICGEIKRLGLRSKTLAVEDNYTPAADGRCTPWFDQVADSLDGHVLRAGDLVSRLRLKKEPEEVGLIRRACAYADDLVRLMAKELAAGRDTEQAGHIARGTVESKMRRELNSVFPSLATGDVVEGHPQASALADDSRGTAEAIGTLLAINCFAVVGAYHGESERCGVVGVPTRSQSSLFEILVQAQQQAVEKVGPGVTCEAVDQVARSRIEGAGFDYLYGAGHGIGLLGHEPPWLRSGCKTVLEPGMCVTVEPELAVRGEGSFHCSQTILVTEQGHEILTVDDGIHRLDLP